SDMHSIYLNNQGTWRYAQALDAYCDELEKLQSGSASASKKEQIIELFDKHSNETDLFKPFITRDEFSDLADDLVAVLMQAK
ncbi:MAG: hypothetical protein JXR36_03775, partial [Bacteroidales bacterium]|nr:hypothetical protein [Bacteroidales bacterium]